MGFDFAAQPFFTVVVTFVFGPYFVSRLAPDPATGQAWWALAATLAGVAAAIGSPLLGAIADRAGPRKPWIAGLAVLQVGAVSLLWFAAPGSSLAIAAGLIVVAQVAAEFSIVFNDAMIPRLVHTDQIGRVSNIAWGLGYAGGIIFLFVTLGLSRRLARDRPHAPRPRTALRPRSRRRAKAPAPPGRCRASGTSSSSCRCSC